MSSTADSTGGHTGQRTHGACRSGRSCGGSWSGFNIAAMVLGFVLWWPIGLFILLWIVMGRDVQDLPDGIRRQWARVSEGWSGHAGARRADATDNVVFNEFQQAQYERVREIKDEIRERTRRFRDFRANAKRRADEEEFERFMSDAP